MSDYIPTTAEGILGQVLYALRQEAEYQRLAATEAEEALLPAPVSVPVLRRTFAQQLDRIVEDAEAVRCEAVGSRA